MIRGADAVNAFVEAGVDLAVGVPDSLMKGFIADLEFGDADIRHVSASNEGSAVAVAAGHYLTTGRPGLVYMQNSGLGNAVNPLASLTSTDVYGIPMVLLVGWRGMPGSKDEPQHSHQGRVTPEQLALLEIPTHRLHAESDDVRVVVQAAVDETKRIGSPVAILVEKGTFVQSITPESTPSAGISRLEVLEALVDGLPPEALIVATTGYTGRELALLRERRAELGSQDFLMVGSMGHAAAISLGMAVARPDLQVVCVDGDGALAMHLGVLTMIGNEKPTNLWHVMLNNGVHESVGGQPTTSVPTDFPGLAGAAGYPRAFSLDSSAGLADVVATVGELHGPVFVEVMIRPGSESPLPRPAEFHARKESLMRHVDDRNR